jgi:hypothetical protein
VIQGVFDSASATRRRTYAIRSAQGSNGPASSWPPLLNEALAQVQRGGIAASLPRTQASDADGADGRNEPDASVSSVLCGSCICSSRIASVRRSAPRAWLVRHCSCAHSSPVLSLALAEKINALERRYDAQSKVVFQNIRELIAAKPKELPALPSKKKPLGFRQEE